MRILDVEHDRALDDVTIYLTISEAREMLDSLRTLLANGRHHHVHVMEESLQREIAIAVYTEDNLEGFDDRSKRLITEGT